MNYQNNVILTSVFKLLVATFCVLFFTNNLYANNISIHVTKQLTYKEGLSHFGVTCLETDTNGLLWVGTFKGLNIYDGYEFKSYYYDKYPALLSNRITTLLNDSNGNMVIGTEKGVSVYKESLGSFETVVALDSLVTQDETTSVKNIVETDNYIVCNTGIGVLYFINKSDYTFERKEYLLEEYHRSFKTLNLSTFIDDKVLIPTNWGLFTYDIKERKSKQITTPKVQYCIDAVFDGRKNIYALTYKDLYTFTYNQETEEIELSTKLLEKEYFSQLKIGESGELWLMKNNNEVALITEPLYFKNIKNNIVRYQFQSDFTRLSSLVLNENGGWIGSYNQGIFQFYNKNPSFHYSGLKERYKENKSSQVISLLPVSSEEVYITLNSNDNKLFNIKSQEAINIKHPNINNQTLTKVLIDNKGQVWGGSQRKGIFIKKSLLSSWQQLKFKDLPDFDTEGAQAIVQDPRGNIWLAGLRALYKLEVGSDGSVQILDRIEKLDGIEYRGNIKVNVLYPDPYENCIWLGTNGKGLFKIETSSNLNKENCVQFKTSVNQNCHLLGSSITCIKRLPNKQLWVGVLEGGISKLIEENGDYCFQNYTEKEGLDDNDVMTFEYDIHNRLWIATNKGINQFNPQTEVFTNFTTRDGLIPASFEVVSTKLPNGLMIFGGNNGICYFNPNKVTTKVYDPKLLFGELDIHNKKVEVGKGILEQVLNKSDKIELDYDQNSFSIELISLHYENANSHGLRYRLLPKENNWNITSSNNKIANYNLLPPGDYVFEAQASNSKNEWLESRKLHIKIKEAWWMTSFAKFIYLVLIVVLISIVMIVVIRFKSLNYKLQLEHLEKTKLKDLDTARLKLFMNISHEFRTPLTLINGPISILKNMFENNQDAFEHIDLVQRQSKKMLQLVDQVHEIRKADQNLLKLKIESFDFTHLITDVKKDFDKLAETSKKKLKLIGTDQQLLVDADPSKLEIVINNLLNNAFKFTKKEDTITLSYSYQDDKLILTVEDTGRGISKEAQKYIFKRFYQSDNKEIYTAGSGIGLELSKMIIDLHGGEIKVESQENVGTKFTIELPVNVHVTNEVSELKLEESIKEESHDQKQRMLNEEVDLSFLAEEGVSKNSIIYYVEDNIDLRNFVTSILSQHYKIKEFGNGKECLEALGKEWPDVILSDIIMPEMDGLELCKSIKDDVKTSHLPVILLTSKSSSDEKVEGMNVGADAYLTKPFEMKQVVATIENILKNRKKLQDRYQAEVPLPLEKKEISESDQQFLEGFTKLINDNLTNENIDLEQFSKELYMSRSQFFRKVKTITNATPNDIIRTFKLKKAAELLLQNENTVNDVVVMTGFKNRTHFSKLFKEHFGVTPGKYAAKMEMKKEN